jgi:hypothetical protein
MRILQGPYHVKAQGRAILLQPLPAVALSTESVMSATVIGEWPKSIREVLRITLDEFKGRNVVDCRVWFWDRDGSLRPSRQGLTVSTRHLPALAKALSEAAKAAQEQGLLDQRTER